MSWTKNKAAFEKWSKLDLSKESRDNCSFRKWKIRRQENELARREERRCMELWRLNDAEK